MLSTQEENICVLIAIYIVQLVVSSYKAIARPYSPQIKSTLNYLEICSFRMDMKILFYDLVNALSSLLATNTQVTLHFYLIIVANLISTIYSFGPNTKLYCGKS